MKSHTLSAHGLFHMHFFLPLLCCSKRLFTAFPEQLRLCKPFLKIINIFFSWHINPLKIHYLSVYQLTLLTIYCIGPDNGYSHAWTICYCIALKNSMKEWFLSKGFGDRIRKIKVNKAKHLKLWKGKSGGLGLETECSLHKSRRGYHYDVDIRAAWYFSQEIVCNSQRQTRLQKDALGKCGTMLTPCFRGQDFRFEWAVNIRQSSLHFMFCIALLIPCHFISGMEPTSPHSLERF